MSSTMSSAFYLVQWMPGPCTEPGTSKEFSIIGLEDIKDDYRYALETGRITMATYRFRSGSNVGSMHRLCKVLGSAGDKSLLEVDLMAFMNGGEDGSGVYTIEDEKPNQLTFRKQSGSRPPPWEVEKEMLTLLEENHKVKRENEALRTKLAKAVDVGDLKNILETTILNIQKKQIVQPSLNEQTPSSRVSQPIIETLHMTKDMDLISQPQLSSMVDHNMSSMQGFPLSTPVTQRQPPRRAPTVNSVSHQLTRTSSSTTTPAQSQSRAPESETDNPYIVRVQSLAESTPVPPAPPHPVEIRPAGIAPREKQGGNSINQLNRGYTRPSAQINQRKNNVRQRQIKTPHWQASYVSDGITERLRIGRSGVSQSPSMSTNSTIANISAPSIQRMKPITMKGAAQDDHDGDKLVELVVGSGIWLPRKQLKLSQRTKGLSQYTRKLVMLLFNMKELSTSSVTGFKATGKGSENAIKRPALDPKRVHAIITAVQKRFPAASPFKVKQVMSQKLMDIRKTVRNKQLKNATWKQRGLHHGII